MVFLKKMDVNTLNGQMHPLLLTMKIETGEGGYLNRLENILKSFKKNVMCYINCFFYGICWIKTGDQSS